MAVILARLHPKDTADTLLQIRSPRPQCDLSTTKPLQLPTDIPWQHWVERWDRMQERYLVRRAERIQLLVGLVRETVSPVKRVLDLGCGTGSLMHPFLDAFTEAEIYGIDFDPVLLPLAQQRLRPYGARARLILADLRSEDWRALLPASVDAVISATALHWLTEVQLASLYRQLSTLLRSGGIFVNADHVASQQPQVQKYWERNRDQMRRRRQGMTVKIGRVFGRHMRGHLDFLGSGGLLSG